MRTILINGYFFCRALTGIERYAIEITKRLDDLSFKNEIAIIIPKNTKNIPPFKNLKVIYYQKKIPHVFWQMFTLQFFLLTHRKYLILDFGNTCLPFAPGIVFLHDIYCEFFPDDWRNFRDKLVRIYNRWQYRLIAKKAKRIATVSFFSRNQIAQTYHISPDRIKVIYSSHLHFINIEPDFSIFEHYPTLLNDSYYFSLGSLSKRKNIKWILDYAIKHSEDIFALSGTALPTSPDRDIGKSTPQNIILLGYLDDMKVKALMKKCKAFLLPSYYEGFGLTALEALSCGAEIIVSKAASLPEIFGDAAHYIDPFDTNINLNELLSQPVSDPRVTLEKYSFDNSAIKVYDLIKEVEYANTI
jgi:glycosyltransferase involved in cell wall biosynthesis